MKKETQKVLNTLEQAKRSFRLYKDTKDPDMLKRAENLFLMASKSNHPASLHATGMFYLDLGKNDDGLCFLKRNQTYPPSLMSLYLFYTWVEFDLDESVKYYRKFEKFSSRYEKKFLEELMKELSDELT